jgi:hypothetical protein
LEVNSPCINAGDPNYVAEPDETDTDGDPRVIGRIDMGIDEVFVKDAAALSIFKKDYEVTIMAIDSVSEAQLIEICNYGAFDLNWHVEMPNNCDWLNIAPLSGQTVSLETSEVLISINHNMIDYGTHICQFQVLDPNAENSPQSVTVNLEVLRPELSIDHSGFYFTADGKESNIEPQILTVQNTGYDILSWIIEIPGNCDWLDISMLSGQAQRLEANQVTISIDNNKIDYGMQSCQFQVLDPNAENSPQTVTVNLNVLRPALSLNQDSFNFIAPGLEGNTPAQTLSIQNTGYDTLNWQIAIPADCNWLVADTLSGSCSTEPNEVTLTIDYNYVDYGNHICQLTVSDPNAENSPQTVTVYLDVLRPSIAAVPVSLEFVVKKGDPNTHEKTFSITNVGYDLLNWQITTEPDCNWLSVSSVAGQCSDEINDVNVIVSGEGLNYGFYNSQLIISDPIADNSPYIVPVIMHVYTPNELHVPVEYPTIQEAAYAANDGDHVIIHPGVYAFYNDYEIYITSKSITVRSIDPNDPEIVSSTVIDGNWSYGGNFILREAPDSVINGLTITRCLGRPTIDCYLSNLRIRNCVLEGNRPYYQASVIYCEDSNASIENCVIRNNVFSRTKYGAGVIFVEGRQFMPHATINNCVITNNANTNDIYMTNTSPAVYLSRASADINNCTIAQNSSNPYYEDFDTSGSGIFVYDGSATISNCIVWGNTATDGSQIAIIDDTWSPYYPEVTISYSNIQDSNDSIVFFPTDPNMLVWGPGNIDVDPCFTVAGYWHPNDTPLDANDDYWVEGDYHLKSEAGRWEPSVYSKIDQGGNGIINLTEYAVLARNWQKKGGFLAGDLDYSGMVDGNDLAILLDGYMSGFVEGEWVFDDVSSLCIDGGDPNSDWSEELWPHGERINIGAYGGTSEASMSLNDVGNVADLNHDGVVNFEDFGWFGKVWEIEQVLLGEDFDRNGVVDWKDLKILCDHWLK